MIAWLRMRRLLRKPVVVDEDGTVHVGVLRPGESIETEVIMAESGQRRVAVVRVLDPKGRVRQEWPTRH